MELREEGVAVLFPRPGFLCSQRFIALRTSSGPKADLSMPAAVQTSNRLKMLAAPFFAEKPLNHSENDQNYKHTSGDS